MHGQFSHLILNALHISDFAHKPQKTFVNVTVSLIRRIYFICEFKIS
jgi:hypothetical protein